METLERNEWADVAQLVEITSDAVIICELDGTILHVNNRLLDLMCEERADVIGGDVKDVLYSSAFERATDVGDEILYLCMVSVDVMAFSPEINAWRKLSCCVVSVSVMVANSRLSCLTNEECASLTIASVQQSEVRSQESWASCWA